MKIKDLYKEHESLPNNPLIAAAFYYTVLIDAWGMGILNIVSTLKEHGLPLPIFKEAQGFFRIEFKREKTREKIISLIENSPKTTTEELSKRVGISIKGVEWQLSKLKKGGLIKRHGSRKQGHWEAVGK